ALPPADLSPLCCHHPAATRTLHTFPTRRSSDLGLVERGQIERDAELHRGDRQPALGVRVGGVERGHLGLPPGEVAALQQLRPDRNRKSTRLNSSHLVISYAVFCLKKKNNTCHAA